MTDQSCKEAGPSMIDINKKYTTRDGNEVRIYATDGNGHYPVHGALFDSEGLWSVEEWTSYGSYCAGREHNFDIIEVKEPEQEEPDVDALQAELYAALMVAFNSGGADYVRDNYPEKYAEFAGPQTVTRYQSLYVGPEGESLINGGWGRCRDTYDGTTHILRLDITGDEVTATVEKVS